MKHKLTDNVRILEPAAPEKREKRRSWKGELKDKFIISLKPAAPHDRDHYWDTKVDGFGVRVTDQGVKTYVLFRRWPPTNVPARRRLGNADEMSLADAREKAEAWVSLIANGKDPKEEKRKEEEEEKNRRSITFAAVAEAWFKDKLPGERKGREVEQDVRREFVALWGQRPVTDITKKDVRTLIKGKAAKAPAQARNLLGYIKRLFAWAVAEDDYGLQASPCASLKPNEVVGDKTEGERTLSDGELFALWRAIKRLPYPYGPVYRLLILTALRLNEVADASWSEFDLRKKIWVIPARRMKGRNKGRGKARAHAVPLTDEIEATLESLPRFRRGEYLFSTTFGEKPVWMSAKIKKRVDARMLRTLRALARRRGEDTSRVKMNHWTNHDIRRSVRSNLSRLKIAEEAREAVLAHARHGIKGVYDHHDYFDEKREALTLWAARLRSIVEPPPPVNNNVFDFDRAKGA